MKTLTVLQLKALLGIYDDNDTIEILFKEPVKEVAYNEFIGGNEVRIGLEYLEGDKEKHTIKMVLSK